MGGPVSLPVTADQAVPSAHQTLAAFAGHVLGRVRQFRQRLSGILRARSGTHDIPPGDNVVAPADGLVFGIPRRDGTAYFIVNLSFWDVHVVRSPVAGIVKDVSQEGLYLARTPTAAQMRESIFLHGKAAPVQSIITLDTGHGDIKIRLITSYWASRLKVWVHEGDRLAKGERIGRIVLGSTVAVEFPDTMEFSVQPRQRVVGGETIISKKGVGS